jgi:hypothetical protein
VGLTMKRSLLTAAASCLLAAGCMGLSTSRNPAPPGPKQVFEDKTPTASELVHYLNTNASKVNSLESGDLDIDIKADTQTFGVRGALYCQKPRNFRMRAKLPAVGKRVADFGSNDREFWYWISEDRPPNLYHCSYADMAQGNVRLPFPLHPDWMLEALGLGAPPPVGTPEEEQARGRSFEVKKTPDNKFLQLYERTRSIQGQPVTKVTVLNNFQATGTQPQVVGYFLQDASGRTICQATVTKVQYDAASGAVVPQRMELRWPDMKLGLALTLGDVTVNKNLLATNRDIFARPPNVGDKQVDLARMTPFTTPTNGVRRTGAYR